MSHLAQHMRTRLLDGRVIATTTEERRLAMRTIFRLTLGSNLLAVALVDAHLHLLAMCSSRAASVLVHRIEASLKQRLGLPVGFAMYPHEPVRDARHLRYGFRYVLTQHDHHGLQIDPHREGTNLPDLVGLRLVGTETHANVRRWLPRISRAELLGWLGAPRLKPAHEPVGAAVEAGLAAACLGELHGSARPAQEVRRAVLEVMGRRVSVMELAAQLGVTERTVHRLRRRPVDPRLVEAVRLQLGLRNSASGAVELSGGGRAG